MENLRKNEQAKVSLHIADGHDSHGNKDRLYLAIYDERANEKLKGWLSIGITILVCIVLGSGAMIFSKITSELVITPIEDMVGRIANITDDPLKAAH